MTKLTRAEINEWIMNPVTNRFFQLLGERNQGYFDKAQSLAYRDSVKNDLSTESREYFALVRGMTATIEIFNRCSEQAVETMEHIRKYGGLDGSNISDDIGDFFELDESKNVT